MSLIQQLLVGHTHRRKWSNLISSVPIPFDLWISFMQILFSLSAKQIRSYGHDEAALIERFHKKYFCGKVFLVVLHKHRALRHVVMSYRY